MRAYKRWTPEEDARLLQLHDEQGWFFTAIDVELGRTKNASSDRYKLLRRKRGDVAAKPPNKTSRTLLRDAIRAHETERMAGGHASITAMVFGDPPPGHSALDQKMGTYCR